MARKLSLGLWTALSLVTPVAVSAQAPALQQSQQQTAPKTALEAFSGQTGSVTIKSYKSMGAVKGVGTVGVDMMMFTDAASGHVTAGAVVQVDESAVSYPKSQRAFIDYDEIEGLVAGADYIAKVTKSPNGMPNFEAKYSTKGNLSVTVFNDSAGKLQSVVQAGQYGSASAYLTLAQLDLVRGNLARVKELLQPIVDGKK